ncbi:MAG: 2-oxo-4-hydroxy-4-carboxy-5-ureidoimidazoline decarboxylase [Polyangiales bacterium]
MTSDSSRSAAVGVVDVMNEEGAMQVFLRCCGAKRWAATMCTHRPFHSAARLHEAADEVFSALAREDLLEAFAAHPRIGERTPARGDSGALEAGERDAQAVGKSAGGWASGEQAGARDASLEVSNALAELNRAYQARFGYIFIVCATGKTAKEMLGMCRARLANDPDQELRVAESEQRQIVHLRLDKLLSEICINAGLEGELS